jgi:hypothetical protein
MTGSRAQSKRHIDTRFKTLEERTDLRLETHERAVDANCIRGLQDIVDRNDLMLQISSSDWTSCDETFNALHSAASPGRAGVQQAVPYRNRMAGDTDPVTKRKRNDYR